MFRFSTRFFLFCFLSFFSLSAARADHSLRDEARKKIFSALEIADPQETQQLWVQQGKERWEFDRRCEDKRDQLWPLFEEAGLVGDVLPVAETYDYVLIPGALASRMEQRWASACRLWEKGIRFSKIVCLSGKRNLQESEKKRIGDASIQTEFDAFQWVCKKHPAPLGMDQIEIQFINAEPAPGNNRPTTVDTIGAWLGTSPEKGSCLVVSNQPYIQYQHLIFKRILPEGFSVETVGEALDWSPPVALMLDTLGRILAQEQLLDQ